MTHDSHAATGGTAATGRLLAGLAMLIALYAAAAAAGWPQHGRDLLVAAQASHHEHAPHESDPGTSPPAATVIPFCLLLAAIAILPLTPQLAHWWEHNSSKFLVAGVLGLATLAYYLFLHRYPVDLHFPTHAAVAPAVAGPSWGVAGAVLANAFLSEYVPFIVLLFALYVISGGVRIEGDLVATPRVNTTFLGVGALAASFIGTTGAAMLLVRPLLETNRERRHVAHTLVFFIFLVCNTGGCLLPIGDPPLFLGYLEGVDFFWTTSLWREWLFTNGVLLAIYWAWDTFFAHPREAARDIARDERQTTRLRISGLWPNAALMAGVIAAVALLDPSKAVPGTGWHPWIFLREIVLLTLVGIDSPRAFFWATGALSSVLDNAPTYLVFFKTAQTLPAVGDTMAGVDVGRLAGVSLGAVFLGAMTYIGNGPNFMVKAIAEQSGVRMPSFFGYLLYSFGVLLPVFAVMSFLFF